ncbi:MAG: hypothetical protein HY917_02870 [Candidatus Diapherotrites archaeon]|nr:hypothetical protein [Candidatus Diapherotrites archaeon]
MKICLACSGGGHLDELLNIRSAYESHPHYYVTFERPNSAELSKTRRVQFVECPSRNLLKTIRNFIQSWKILRRENPQVVISTGADAALATCLLAKLTGKKVIFIESMARAQDLSLSGKIIYPFADLFIVQWKELTARYPKAVFGGCIYGS